ncbi:DNA polymerase III subunit gamma/tau [Enteroscipio rubneri]|uniref:DNA polymerase III subunit gamma/tau n=1 Tax=Enteroscipio rubneri TaxID=2070686 RepID=UPI003AB6F202
MSEALYRKYRPQIFEDVVGQERIERTIKNAIEQDKVSHAYLFTGPRGTGKTTTARLLAKALLCEHGPTSEPDGTCDDCVMIANGEHPDVYELDAASRTGVENVREEIIGRVQFAPTRGRYKVYIIDEVHMLSTAAFNALLKTLEEPPSHVVFILATTDPQKVPETIHSRCQRFDFRRISAEAIVSRLGAICVSEDVEFEGEALDLIAHRAEGGMRNALTSLEQLIAFGEGKVTLEVAERLLGGVDTNDLAEIVRFIGQRDVAACFRWTAEYVETGADLAQFARDLSEHVRNLYVMSLTDADVALEVGATERRQLTGELTLFGSDRLARLLGVLGDLSAELKTSTNPRLSFEIALTRMVRPDSDLTLAGLAERVEALESGYSAVAHVTGADPAGDGSQIARSAPPIASSPASNTAALAAQAASTGVADEPFSMPRGQAPSAVQNGRGESDDPVQTLVQTPSAVSDPAAPPVPASGSVAPEPSAAEPAAAPAVPAAASVARTGKGPSDQLIASLRNPAALQRVWQAALVALKKNKAAYGVLFLNTKAIYDEAKSLFVIEFPAENAFAFKAVQKPDVQDAVSAALVQATGETLAFAYTQNGTSVPPAPSAAPVETPTMSPRPIARAASSARAQAETAVSRAAQPPASSNTGAPIAPVATCPASAPAQPARASVPPAAPSPSMSVDPDQVPVDLYDDLPPYEDERVPYDDEFAPALAGASADRSAPAPARSPQIPAAAPAASASVPLPSVGSAAPAAPDPAVATAQEGVRAPVSADAVLDSPDDLRAVLEASFGDGVVVEEVRE